jgi:hypothetical protein
VDAAAAREARPFRVAWWPRGLQDARSVDRRGPRGARGTFVAPERATSGDETAPGNNRKKENAMNIDRAIRNLRRSVGLEPSGFDLVTPAVGAAVGLVALGMLAGAGIALLFAPMTGKKLREEMEHKFTDLRSRLMLPEAGSSHGNARNNIAIGQSEQLPRI